MMLFGLFVLVWMTGYFTGDIFATRRYVKEFESLTTQFNDLSARARELEKSFK